MRKIDARNQFKFRKKKTHTDIQMDILNNNNDTYRIKLQEGFREEMAKDSSGNSIVGKMPQFLIQFDGLEVDAPHYVTRVDDNAHNAGLMAGNVKQGKEMFERKDLCEIATEALNAPYIPHPQVAEDMHQWDKEFEKKLISMRHKEKRMEQQKIRKLHEQFQSQKRGGIYLNTHDLETLAK